MRFVQEISVFNPKAIDRAVINLSTDITQTADEIRLEAQRTYATQDQTRALISIKADEILSTVKDTYVDGTTFQSAISQTPHSIELTVSNSGVINKRGSTSAGIKITMKDANGNTVASTDTASIYINGSVVFTGDLGESGTTTVNGGRIHGGTLTLGGNNNGNGVLSIVNSSNSQIGKWDKDGITISSGVIKLGSKTSLTDGNTGLYMSSGGIALGKSNTFKVTDQGVLTTTNGIIGSSATAANVWHIGGGSSGANNRAWIYSGNKSILSSKNAGIYIGTDGIEVREGSGAANSWTRIVGGVTETTQLKIYDGGGTRYGTMVISDETRDMPSEAGQYFRIGFSNGIVTGASGEDRGGNIFLNRTWCYNNLYARRDVTFGDNDEPGSSDYGRFYLYQNGTYYGSWNNGSDRRLKKNIKHIDPNAAKAFIMALKPSEYQLIKNKDGKWHHGFIAQEVKEIGWDGLVGCDEQNDNMLSLAYTEFIADLIATVQLQQQEIDALKGVING